MANALPDSIMGVLAGTRKVTYTIKYQNRDITPQIENSLLDLVYRERLEDNTQTFSLTLRLADPEGLWRQTFTLSTYDSVDVTLNIENWDGSGKTMSKTLSRMWIKSIDIDQEKSSGITIRLVCSSVMPQS